MGGLAEYLAGENDGPGGVSRPSRMTAVGRPGGAYKESRHPISGRYLGRLPYGCEWDGTVGVRSQRGFRVVVDDLGETVVVRRCCDCLRWYPRDDFTARVRDERGVATAWEVRCGQCKRASQRARYAKNRARARAAATERYQRIMADPDRAARRREVQRAQAARRRALKPDVVRAEQRRYQQRLMADPQKREQRNADARMTYRLRTGSTRVVAASPRGDGGLSALPAKPLADAIERLIATHAAGPNIMALEVKIRSDRGAEVTSHQAGTQDGSPRSREAICARLGIAARNLHTWNHVERATVQFDTADRVLTRAGWCWWDVWTPEQAQHVFEEEEAA